MLSTVPCRFARFRRPAPPPLRVPPVCQHGSLAIFLFVVHIAAAPDKRPRQGRPLLRSQPREGRRQGFNRGVCGARFRARFLGILASRSASGRSVLCKPLRLKAVRHPGFRPFTPATGVQIPYGTPFLNPSMAGISEFYWLAACVFQVRNVPLLCHLRTRIRPLCLDSSRSAHEEKKTG